MSASHQGGGAVPLARRVFDAARGGDRDQLVDLLADGLPVDLTTASGETLLVLAASGAHPAVVDLLLAHGADHAIPDFDGRTALAAAVSSRCAPAVESLMAAGADPDRGSPSAVEVARATGLPELTTLLETCRRPDSL